MFKHFWAIVLWKSFVSGKIRTDGVCWCYIWITSRKQGISVKIAFIFSYSMTFLFLYNFYVTSHVPSFLYNCRGVVNLNIWKVNIFFIYLPLQVDQSVHGNNLRVLQLLSFLVKYWFQNTQYWLCKGKNI